MIGNACGPGRAGVEKESAATEPVLDHGTARGRRIVEAGRGAETIRDDRGDARGVGIDEVERALIGDCADDASRCADRADLQGPANANERSARVGIRAGEYQNSATESVRYRQLSGPVPIGDIAGDRHRITIDVDRAAGSRIVDGEVVGKGETSRRYAVRRLKQGVLQRDQA